MPDPRSGPPRDFVGYGRNPPKVRWPDGSAVAVNLVLNYEEGAEYSLLDGDADQRHLGRDQLDGRRRRSATWAPRPTTSSAAASASGGSRGSPRSSAIPISVDAPALALERNPQVAQWLREGRHDVIGHGYRWTEDSQMTREEEREYLRLAIESVERTTGQRVRGWMVRTMPSVNTRELLVEEGGFLYDSDASNDELPYFVDVKRHAVPRRALLEGLQRRQVLPRADLRAARRTSSRACAPASSTCSARPRAATAGG